VGRRAFARGFQQKEFSDEEKIFLNYEKCVRRGFDWREVVTPRWRRVGGVDLSSDQRPGNVICMIAVEPETGVRCLIDVEDGAWTSPQTAAKIKEKCDAHKPDAVGVENNAYQQAILDWSAEKFGRADLPLRAFTTGRNKADPQFGVASLEVEFENGAWIFPMPAHGADCRCAWCKLDRQLSDYPNCGEIDHLMALWMAREQARLLGMSAKVQGTGDMTAREEARWRRTAFALDDEAELDEYISRMEGKLKAGER
jgi:hypothetical protein